MNAEIRLIMENYRTGDTEKKKKAMENLCNLLDSFVGMIIYREYRNYSRDREDLFQCGRLGIIRGMENYNPEMGAPTTFFYKYIKHEIQDYVNSSYNNSTIYYETVSAKLRKTEDELKSAGTKCDDILLAEVSGLPLSTVKRTRNSRFRLANATETAKDDDGNLYKEAECGSLTEDSAENSFLRGSLMDTVREKMETELTEDERKIVGYLYGFAEGCEYSVKDVADMTGMSCADVRKTNIRALSKLGQTELSDYRNCFS